MILSPELIFKMQLTLAILLGAAGLIVVVVRRAAYWTGLGVSLLSKGVLLAAGSWLIAGPESRHLNLAKLLVLCLAVLFVNAAGAMAVSLAAKRSSGSLDMEKEASLRN